MKIYRNLSIDAVKEKNASLSAVEVVALAKEQFNRAGEEYFIKSLRIGRNLRPKRLWGY